MQTVFWTFSFAKLESGSTSLATTSPGTPGTTGTYATWQVKRGTFTCINTNSITSKDNNRKRNVKVRGASAVLAGLEKRVGNFIVMLYEEQSPNAAT